MVEADLKPEVVAIDRIRISRGASTERQASRNTLCRDCGKRPIATSNGMSITKITSLDATVSSSRGTLHDG
jgi:hypothetical protein